MITFLHVVVFTAFWPIVCFATLAATEKVCADRIGDTKLAAPISNVLTWLMSGLVLSIAAHDRFFSHTPSIALEYMYVGTVLGHMCFHSTGKFDRERLFLVAIVYLITVYIWSDHWTLTYATTFAFFRALHATYPAAVELGMTGLETRGWTDAFMAFLRVTEVGLLTTLCVREMWMSGMIEIVCLTPLTVWGIDTQSFVKHKPKRDSVKM